MSELRDLYQEVILDHYKNPRNFGQLQNPTHRAHGVNPLCGDQIKIFLEIRDGNIDEVKFTGSGCAISTASASIMTEALHRCEVGDAVETAKSFCESMRGGTGSTLSGKMKVFEGVREFPSRVKCATLAWHALLQAIDSGQGEITTE